MRRPDGERRCSRSVFGWSLYLSAAARKVSTPTKHGPTAQQARCRLREAASYKHAATRSSSLHALRAAAARRRKRMRVQPVSTLAVLIAPID